MLTNKAYVLTDRQIYITVIFEQLSIVTKQVMLNLIIFCNHRIISIKGLRTATDLEQKSPHQGLKSGKCHFLKSHLRPFTPQEDDYTYRA